MRPIPPLSALAFACFSAAACTGASETGTPGPLGAAYDGASYYTYLAVPADEIHTDEHRALFDAIKAAAPFDAAGRVEHEQVLRAVDDGAFIARMVAQWQTWEIDGKHLVLAASLEATEYADGWRCSAEPPAAREGDVAFFQVVDFGVRCDWATTNKSSMVGFSIAINDRAAGGGLEVLAGEVELE